MNKIIISGNLTRDPELRYTPQGKAVLNLSIANNYGIKDNKKTCFVECVCWEKTAETINQYFKKGKPILIEGRLEQHEWKDKEEKKHSKHIVTVERFEFIGGDKKEAQPEEATPTDIL